MWRWRIGARSLKNAIDFLYKEWNDKAAGFVNDELRVVTWVGKLEGLTFERHIEIIRATDEKLLARVRTLWVPINPETGRPKRVSPEVREIFSRAADAA